MTISRRTTYSLLLIAIGATVYATSLPAPFIFDDVRYIEQNEALHELWPPRWATGNTPVTGRPLTALSFVLSFETCGSSAICFRRHNILLHLLCGLALFATLQRLLLRIPRLTSDSLHLSFSASMLWLLHPLNSEVVIYIAQRSSSLMALCYLLTLYCFLRGCEGNLRWHGASVLLCAAGMASKEVMVSAPLIVLTCDAAFLSGSFGKSLRYRPWLYGGLGLSWIVLAHSLWTRPHGDTIGFEHAVGAWDYLLNQSQMIFTYLARTVWPHPLLIDYGFPRALTLVDVWWQSLIVVMLLASSTYAFMRWPWWGFSGVFFFALLAPTSSFIPIVTEVGAERRMYLPLAALLSAAIVGFYLLTATKTLAKRRPAALVIVAVLLGGVTIARGSQFRNELALWQAAAHAFPNNPRALNNIGTLLETRGNLDGATDYYRRATSKQPAIPHALYNLGRALESMEDLPKAIAHYRQAVSVDSTLVEAHNRLGLALARSQHTEEAVASYRRAIALAPKRGDFYSNLAMSLLKLKRGTEALGHSRRAVLLLPSASSYNTLGVSLLYLGQRDNAILQFREALRRDSNFTPALTNLNTLMAQEAVP